MGHIFYAQNLRPQYGRCSLTSRIFAPKKDQKRRNLGGQAADTLTHLKALILIHNNNTGKIENGACHQPGPACRPVSAVDRRPGERNFFFRNLTRRRTEVASFQVSLSMKSDVLTAETGGMVQEIIMPRLLRRGVT